MNHKGKIYLFAIFINILYIYNYDVKHFLQI